MVFKIGWMFPNDISSKASKEWVQLMLSLKLLQDLDFEFPKWGLMTM